MPCRELGAHCLRVYADPGKFTISDWQSLDMRIVRCRGTPSSLDEAFRGLHLGDALQGFHWKLLGLREWHLNSEERVMTRSFERQIEPALGFSES